MMNDFPKVSIIIPVFNGSNFLKESIDSALNQTYSNIEVIVVNDGSNDAGATEAVALSYGERIKYFFKSNGGVSTALNFGIENMTGDYFSWLSHDDLYFSNKIEEQVNALNGQNVILYSNYLVFNQELAYENKVILPSIASRDFRTWITIDNKLNGCTVLIPRKAFLDCGKFDPKLKTTQDYDLWFRLAGQYDFVLVPRILIKSRHHYAQDSHRLHHLAVTECDQLITKFIKNLSQDSLSFNKKTNFQILLLIFRSAYERKFAKAAKSALALALKEKSVSLFKKSIELYFVLLFVLKIHGRDFIGKTLRKSMTTIKRIVSILMSVLRRSKVQDLSPKLDARFTRIYKENLFGGEISRSGEGSNLDQTQVIRTELPRIITKYDVNTLIDAPCGDWFWMKEVDLGEAKYIGLDIVNEIVDINSSRFKKDGVRFLRVDITKDKLPDSDMIFSRDCLVHLSLNDCVKVIRNFRASGATYLLTTTFTDLKKNVELEGKNNFWRPLNLELPPFNFPKPIELINERCTEAQGKYKSKCLALWKLVDINL